MKSLSLAKPHVIVMVGVPGSGKSFFAEKFATTFHAPYISLDYIAGLADVSADVAFDIMHYQLSELLKTKQSILIEGSSDTRSERQELAKIARAAGYELLLVWVQIDAATAKHRVVKQAKADQAQLFDVDTYNQTVKRFSPPTATEKPIVISGKHTYASQAKVVLKKLSEPRGEISAHTTPPVRPPRPERHNITIR